MRAITTTAFGIPVPDSSWFVDDDDDSVEDVPNVDEQDVGRMEDETVLGMQNSFRLLLQAANTSSYGALNPGPSHQPATPQSSSSWPRTTAFGIPVPSSSWFDSYDDDDLEDPPDVGDYTDGNTSSQEKHDWPVVANTQSRPLLLAPNRTCANRAFSYLAADDSSSQIASLAETDVSSHCTTPLVGGSGMLTKGNEEEDDDCAYSSWFAKSAELHVLEDEEVNPFFEKLHRAKERVVEYSKTNSQRKLSAKEGYNASFDYGTRNIKGGSNATEKCRPGDYNSTSGDKKDGQTSSITSRGIARPEPLESHRTGEQEFILPTVIVGSNIWNSFNSSSSVVSPLSTPDTAFERPTVGRTTSSSSRSSSSSRRIAGLPFASPRGLEFDDMSSVGSNVSGYTHYSRCDSDNIGRLIHRCEDDDTRTEGGFSHRSLPFFIADLEQRVRGLADQLEVVSKDRERLSNVLASPTRSLANPIDDPSLSKVFVLLLAPVTKKFELIQIVLRLSIATIGEILDRIPAASTVPELGKHPYVGLCRPKDGIEMTNLSVPAGKVPGGWRIIRGEILASIPQGYTGLECMSMSRQILHNPKLIKLLRRKDPLAPKRKRGKSRSRSKGDSVHYENSSGGKSSQKVIRSSNLQAVDENAVVNQLPLPPMPLLANIVEQNQVPENLKGAEPQSAGTQTGDIVSMAEEQVQLLKSIANHSYKTSLEDVREEEEDDDDVTLASEVWDERVQAAGLNATYVSADLMDVLMSDEKTRAIKIKVLEVTDDATLKSMCAFFAVLICRHLFKGVSSTAPPMGASGLVFCAAVFKSLIHLQRVHNAHHEKRHDTTERGDLYGYKSWRKAANL